MASLFVKGMIGGALDEATERNRRRDAASEAMTNLAIDNINEARKIQAEREQEIKARENKANRISKQLGIDIDAAKAFLNDFDPNNNQNPFELEKLYRQIDVQQLDKLDASTKITPIIPGSGSMISPETTGGTFGDMFRMPTTRDAFTRAEEQLGLKPGEGVQYYESATQSYTPNVLETDYGYSFAMKAPGLDTIAKNDIREIEQTFTQMAGGDYDAVKGGVFPNQYLDSAGQLINTADSINYDASAFYNDAALLGQDIYANQRGNRQVPFGQKENTYIAESAFLAASLSNINRGVIAGNPDAFKDQTLVNDPTGFYGDQVQIAENGIIPYNGFTTIAINSGKFKKEIDPKTKKEIYPDLQYTYNGQVKTLSNSKPRPELSITEQRAIELGTLDPNKVMRGNLTLKDAQKAWDAEEQLKLDVLERITSTGTRNSVVASVYGEGTYSTIHGNLLDGLAGRTSVGTGEGAEIRFIESVNRALENYKGSDEAREGWKGMVTNIGTKQIQKNLLEKELITTKELGDLYENGFIPFEVLVEPGDPDFGLGFNAARKRGEADRGGAPVVSYRLYKDGKVYDRNGNELKN